MLTPYANWLLTAYFRGMELARLTPLEFDDAVIARHNGSGPFYTSYPTADRFMDGSVSAQYMAAVRERQAGHDDAPLSLYVHLPFCDTVCHYLRVQQDYDQVQRPSGCLFGRPAAGN